MSPTVMDPNNRPSLPALAEITIGAASKAALISNA